MLKNTFYFILGSVMGCTIFVTVFYYMDIYEFFDLDSLITIFSIICCITFGLLDLITTKLFGYCFRFNYLFHGLVLSSLYIILISLTNPLNFGDSSLFNLSIIIVLLPLVIFLAWFCIDFFILRRIKTDMKTG